MKIDASTIKCNCRDKAQGPWWPIQPYQPSIVPAALKLIKCTFEPHQRPKKKGHHTCKHVLIPGNPCWMRSQKLKCLSSNVEKGRLAQLTSTNAQRSSEKSEARHCGQLFNKSTGDRWDPKNGQLFHFRKRITRLKVWIQRSSRRIKRKRWSPIQRPTV